MLLFPVLVPYYACEGGLPRTGAKAPVVVPSRTALGLGEFRMNLLVEGVRIWSFCGKQLHPRWFFKIVAHQKRVMFCLYDSVDLPPVKGCEAS